MIQHEKLLEILDYDVGTGIFTWKIKMSQRAQIGGIAGTVSPDGYRKIGIYRKLYTASRLAWFYVNKEWPNNEMDHRNRNRDDNCYANLRQALPVQNTQNKGIYKNNKTGFKGVFLRESGRYRAYIRVMGKLHHLGGYKNAVDAALAYNKAAIEHFGDFANLNIIHNVA